MNQGTLSVRIRNVKDVTVIDLTGRLILGDSEQQLRGTIRDLLESGHKKVAVNLSEVSYIDSSGTGCLVSGWTSAHNLGAQFKMYAVPKKVQLVLKIARLDSVVEMYEDEASVMASF